MRSFLKDELILKNLTYNSRVFKNKLNIKDLEELEKAEKKIITIRSLQLPYSDIQKMDFGLDRLIATNKFLLEDLYDFAGQLREIDYYDLNLYEKYGTDISFSSAANIKSDLEKVFNNLNSFWDYYTDIEKIHLFSACIADMYLVSPFYRCNDTTLMLFATEFAKQKLNIEIDPVKLLTSYNIEKMLYNYQFDNTALIKAIIDCDISSSNNHFYDMFPEDDYENGFENEQ